MIGLLFTFFAFDLAWRGYGWRGPVYIAMFFVGAMTIVGEVDGLLLLLATFEIIFVLPGWGLGLLARGIVGGGEKYSFKMSFNV